MTDKELKGGMTFNDMYSLSLENQNSEYFDEARRCEGDRYDENRKMDCLYCEGAKPLVEGKTDDKGIAIFMKSYVGATLIAYGYDVHGPGSNGLTVKINFCPICGKDLRK